MTPPDPVAALAEALHRVWSRSGSEGATIEDEAEYLHDRLHAAGWSLSHDSEREALVAALKTLVEDTPCRFDHHGGCQEHGFLEPDDPWSPCPMAEAQRLVGMSEQKPVYDRRPSRAAIEGGRT